MDRPVLLMALLITVLSIIYSVYVAFSLSPTDSQIATRYTAFGLSHLYRNQWFYLIGFVVFGLAMAVVHVGLILKLHSMQQRALAIAFGWLAVGITIIAAIITHSILTDIAYLS